MKKNGLFAMGIAGLVLVIGGVYLLMTQDTSEDSVPVPAPSTVEIPEGATVVTLTEDGFSPSELSIKAGDTVTFVTKNGKRFWPASNLHPSHELYPEFDPLLPVMPEESWSFTFTKVGEWQYHDHLAPYYTGVITVTE